MGVKTDRDAGRAVACDAPGCAEQIGAGVAGYDAALDVATAHDWAIYAHAQGEWCYCPAHAEAFAARTPRGRPLIGWERRGKWQAGDGR
jgi:hypothetical protein